MGKRVVVVLTCISSAFCLVSKLFLAGAADQDFVVRVHLIDARTGKPIPKKPIRMWVNDGPPLRARPWHLEEETGADGTAVFGVGKPLPWVLEIHIGMGGYWEQCSPTNYYARDVVASGYSLEPFCFDFSPKLRPIAGDFSPKPGEVYIFALHVTLGEKLRMHSPGH